MANQRISVGSNLLDAPIVGDHLAMDLLNTEALNNDEIIDYWNSGDDVLNWLQRTGTKGIPVTTTVGRDELLKQGRELRALARQLIARRKERKKIDVSGLNKYLHAYLSAPHLERNDDGEFVLTRIARCEEAASLLGPVAESIAQLLSEGDFTLVKQCEHPDCVLWFYDRTKAHKRRWCSMALCGNRYKATLFRKRSGGKAV